MNPMDSNTDTIDLQKIPLFHGLSPSQIKIIQGSLKERHYKKGDIIYFEGKACDKILVVRSGRV